MQDNQRKITLVTGASGLVGNNLVRHLLQHGRPVRVLARRRDEISLSGLSVETFVGDVLEPRSIAPLMEGVGTVFHLAGAISIDGQSDTLMKQVNVGGTANVVEACLEHQVDRLIHFSSIHAFSPFPKHEPINESRGLALDPVKHLPYDHSKAAGEQKVREGVKRGLNAVILNPVGILGPHDFGPSPGGEFLVQLMHRKLPGLVQAGYHWVDVRDVAKAAVAAESQGRIGENYILAGEHATFAQIANWVRDFSGARPPFINVPIWVARFAAPWVARYSRLTGIRSLITPEAIQIVECHQHIDTNKADIDLGFQPRPLRETIEDSVQWFQELKTVALRKYGDQV